LVLTETAAPDNAIFNRGVGAFEVWVQRADDWIEGTGKPNAPTSDGVSWNDLAILVNSNLGVSLGLFTNAGMNGQQAFSLSREDGLVADIRAGDEVSFRLVAASAEVGFTFNSRDFGNTNGQPRLEVTAFPNPNPRIDSIRSDGGQIVIGFAATTNWVYRLQRTDWLQSTWVDVLTIPDQTTATNILYTEPSTKAQAFYRLRVSPKP
jgi:hypothetical protein